MTFDLYADLAAQSAVPAGTSLPADLVSGFVDGCASWSAKGGSQKNEGRRAYTERARSGKLTLPEELRLEPHFDSLPNGSWLGIEVGFTLLTPWYSKDDRAFHVLDNPVRKDGVFGMPYMPAASWKGLLRWACRMQDGLLDHLERHDGKLDGWHDGDWLVHLFGNEKAATEGFGRGALAFHPTWFSNIGFEVINPHSRKTRAGTQPIYYEVVPVKTPGILRLLYAPLSGAAGPDKRASEAIGQLLDAIERLLTVYGISAKRTAGWGTAAITGWKAYQRDSPVLTRPALAEFRTGLGSQISRGGNDG